MRDIEFRGLTKERQWVYGYFCLIEQQPFIISSTADYSGNTRKEHSYYVERMVRVLSETVGQDTGLKDNDGNNLNWWEGDILSNERWIFVIVRDRGCFWAEDINRKGRHLLYEEAKTLPLAKVIGNIHETEVGTTRNEIRETKT